MAAFLAAPLSARETGSVPQAWLSKALAANGPVNAAITINNFLIFVDRNSLSPLVSGSGNAADYPKGTGGIIYNEGILWGARVRDGEEPIIRVNGSTYNTGLKAGKVLYDAGGNVIDSEDPSNRHVWRVRRDYLTADLTEDVAYSLTIPIESVTAADVQAVADQYDYDWQNWPADEGAPFEDVDGNGSYDPAIDIPGWPGAAQTIWLVANDLPYADGTEVAPNAYGSPATGMELQLTLWAYDFPPGQPLGNMLFKRARLIYTGLAGGPADAKLDTVYFTQWSDPDLGTYTDDFVGSDTSLSLGYVYNSNVLDGIFHGDFGLPVPAGGYDLLQGPIVAGDTLGMTSFGWFGAGSAISDPDQMQYSGTLQWFNLMEGFLPRPEYPEQVPWTDFITGAVTKFPLAGDPVAGTGDIDGLLLPPGDRRLLLNTGPFQIALGDTQDVVLALIGGLGADNLSSISVLKYHDRYAQAAYDHGFELPTPPPAPIVEAVGLDGRAVLTWGAEVESLASSGYQFEGYKVYMGTSPGGPWEHLATFDVQNGVAVILDEVLDPESGVVITIPVQYGSDSGIQRFYEINADAAGNPLVNGETYYFAINRYDYRPLANGFPRALESDFLPIEIVPIGPIGGIDYAGATADSAAVHISGISNGFVLVDVVDPAAVTGHTYNVTFGEVEGQLVWNLIDVNTGGIVLADQTALSGDRDYSIVDGLLVQVFGSYAAPTDILSVNVSAAAGSYNISTFTYFGYPTSWAYDSYEDADGTTGHGTQNVDILQRDLELRFTGEYDTDGLSIKDGTGSIATFVGARSYAIEDHPLNPDGSTNYFTIRIPFEIWDTEYDNGDRTFGRQVTCIVYDRIQADPAAADFYPTWNPNGRMYIWAVDKAYSEVLLDPDGADADLLTWNLVMWESVWITGDVVHVTYANPIQPGLDTFTFTTTAPTAFTTTKGDVNLDSSVNVADVVALVNIILQIDTPLGEQEYAADVNNDLRLNIADVVGIVNQVLGLGKKTQTTNALASVELGLPELVAIQDGYVNFPLELNPGEPIAGLQVTLTYDPQALKPQPFSPAGDSWEGIISLEHITEEGRVIYLMYSLQGRLLPDLGTIGIRFKVMDENRASEQGITLVEAVVATAAGQAMDIVLGNQETKVTTVPIEYALHQAYPNPFNPVTSIKYDLPKAGLATLQVYNLLGQQVRTLVDQQMPAGRHIVKWQGRDDRGRTVPTGVYFIRFSAGGVIHHNKIMLLK